MSQPAPHTSFLVTSLGAYDDSGVGTGGFVAVHEGRVTVIDAIDSTGLWQVGGVVYRFARGLRSILGYDGEGLRSTLALRGLRDVHDILLKNGEWVCTVTGTNEIVWVSPFGEVTRRWQAEGERDAWHLNCLWEAEGRLYFSAFGRYATHREWTKGGCLGRGFICDLESGRDVVTGLSGPHNPRFIDGTWVVCDSHKSALLLQAPTGEQRSVPLRGFTRGLAYDAHYYYVGESADRKAPVAEPHSSIAVIDRQTLEIVARHAIPFPEIYELVRADPALTAAMQAHPERFQLGRESERLQQAEQQVSLSLHEVHELRRRLEGIKWLEETHAQLVHWKRHWLG